MNRYTVRYKPEYGGYTYEVRCNGRWVYSGWTNGRKRAAERAVREAIVRLQAQAPQQEAA